MMRVANIFRPCLLTVFMMTVRYGLSQSLSLVDGLPGDQKGDISIGDAQSLLRGPPQWGLEMHEEVVGYVRKLTRAPTCAREAAHGLIHDCRELKEGGLDLDHIKSVFAAKLAVCELREAGVTAPTSCDSAALEGRSGFFGFRRDTGTAVSMCVKALEAKPQSWTSYSNSRQNAVLVCQATRSERDREAMLSLFSDLASNNKQSQEAVQSWIQYSEMILQQAQERADRLKSDGDETIEKMASLKELLKDSFGQTEQQFTSLELKLSRALTEIADGAAMNLGQLTTSLTAAKVSADEAARDLMAHSKDAADQQRRDHEASQALFTHLNLGILSMQSSHEVLNAELESMQHQLHAASKQHSSYTNAIADRSESTLKTLTNIEGAVSQLDDAYKNFANFSETFSRCVRFASGAGQLALLLVALSGFHHLGLTPRRFFPRSVIAATLLCATMISAAPPLPYDINFNRVLILAAAITTMQFLVVLLQYYLAGDLSLPKFLRRRTEKKTSNSNSPLEDGTKRAPISFRYYDPSTGDYYDDID